MKLYNIAEFIRNPSTLVNYLNLFKCIHASYNGDKDTINLKYENPTEHPEHEVIFF